MKKQQAARIGRPTEQTAGIASLEAFDRFGARGVATESRFIALAWAAILVAMAMLSGCGEKNKVPEPADANLVQTACGMKMVNIPGGELIMGANNGPVDVKPAHHVKVDGFLMDQTLVTQNVYQKLMGTNPSRRKNPNNPVEQASWTAGAESNAPE
jgi:formylglycine-generating enzyme required for sulfatase activity